ncbi:hypothetical protein Vadar_014445 [Vaccinium darrowii]|uniref:Uncharacterized protein n=1 Tax=Vaccinium darrowii TaxID=229202 RepID=A0ACB7ZBA2_9ERIC|nr:hypothetical protein Vadar_014445 [Vaccinium darrowii]
MYFRIDGEESIPMQMESDEVGTEQDPAISISGEDEVTSVDTTNNSNVINLSSSKEVIPKVGKEFETKEAGYQFYNAYAYKVGFSVCKSSKHEDRCGKITDRVFCCSCQGKRGKDKRNVKSHHSETRFGCLARMKVKFKRELISRLAKGQEAPLKEPLRRKKLKAGHPQLTLTSCVTC